MAKTLTASGMKVERKEADQLRRLIQPWQARALSYYNMVGEIKYASSFYSRSLSQLELFAAERDPDNPNEFVPTTNQEAIDTLARMQDPGGGRSHLLSQYGKLMFLTGESYLLASRDDNDDEQWEMLSTSELRVLGGSTYVRYKAPSLSAEEYEEPDDDDWEPPPTGDFNDKKGKKVGVVYRIWQPSPEYSMMADSTMQGILDLCEELVLLTHVVRARCRSRLASAGILFVDERLTPPTPEAAPDEDAEEDPFLADMIEAMTTAITDEGSASAVAPMLARVTVPDGMKLSDLVYHLQINNPMQLYPETGLRYETIKRMAIGLDMPPEILLGLQDSNHWTSWQIDEQTWKSHLQPKAQQFVDTVTSAFFRPTLRDQGVAEWRDLYIAYDATKIINHPDRGADAKDLYAARAIGKKAYRAAKGFDDNDAPTQDELNEMIGVAIRDGSLALYGEPSKLGVGGVETDADTIITDGSDGGGPAPGDKTGAGEHEGAPKSGKPETANDIVGSAIMAAKLLAVADLAVLRSREAAGNKILTRARRQDDLAEKLQGVATGKIAATLGADAVKQLGLTDEQLSAGSRDMTSDCLRMWQFPDDVSALVCDALERHIARTLYESEPAQVPQPLLNYLTSLALNGSSNGRKPKG